jgi:hypothetical protein
MGRYPETVMAEARQRARGVLARSQSFGALTADEQVRLYRDMVDANAKELYSSGNGLALEQATPPGQVTGPDRSSKLIDDSRHVNQHIAKAGDYAGDFIDAVDFPGFVRDLLNAVFDANLQVTIQQMEAYQKLLKTASADISKFINAIKDDAAFGYLAENKSDEFGITFDTEGDKNEDGSQKLALTDKEGNKLDLGDNEVKAKIMEAKIAMAREQRAMLRETILMGITRLVVEKGTIKASVLFDIKASEQVKKGDNAAVRDSQAASATAEARTGFLTNLVGGASGGGTFSHKRSNISVSTTNSQASTDLAAKLQGSVELIFKSDYFKLDNFATMYGGGQQPAEASGNKAPGLLGGAKPAP